MPEPLLRGLVRIEDQDVDPLEELDVCLAQLIGLANRHKDPRLVELHQRLWNLLRALRGITD